MSAITALLLAAGSASRFGGGKLLATLPDGRAIGLVAFHTLQQALDQIVVVVRSGDAAVRELYAQAGARLIECPDAAQGMSRSLVAGIRATPHAAGWLVALADMPFVSPGTVRNVASAIDAGALIAQPAFGGQRGHPVAFSNRLRDELLTISGDEGARSVLRQHAGDVRIVETDDAGILRDIDTPEDLKRQGSEK